MRQSIPGLIGVRCAARVLALSVVMVLLATQATVGVARAADPRLDTALAALQQAENLLLASEPGTVPAGAERKFDRHVARAIALINAAMGQVEDAKAAVDNP